MPPAPPSPPPAPPAELRALLPALQSHDWASAESPHPGPNWTVARDAAGGWVLCDRRADGTPRRWAVGDRHGHVHAVARWAPDGSLAWATLRTPAGGWIGLEPGTAVHALWGRSDRLVDPTDGRTLARLAALDYPTIGSIPPLDVPGALPPGAPEALLNWLAGLAGHGGAEPLCYVGPYATARLFEGLCRSFAPVGDVDAARAAFSERELDAALAARMVESPVAWRPAPFSPLVTTEGVTVHLRRGIEAVWLGAVPFRTAPEVAPDAPMPAGCRVWPEASGWAVGRATLGAPERVFLRLAGDGSLLEDARPADHPPEVGAPLPAPWQRLIRAWCALRAAPPLAPHLLATDPPGTTGAIRWARLPLALAAGAPEGALVAAAMAAQFRRLALGGDVRALAMMLLSDLVQVLSPHLVAEAQARLAESFDPARDDPSALVSRGQAAQAAARDELNRLAPAIVAELAEGRLPETGLAEEHAAPRG